MMIARILLYICSFVLGAVVVFVPFFVGGGMLHADETARGEPTMLPGIVTFLGLLLSPVRGVIALLIAIWIGRKSQASQKSEEPD